MFVDVIQGFLKKFVFSFVPLLARQHIHWEPLRYFV